MAGVTRNVDSTEDLGKGSGWKTSVRPEEGWDHRYQSQQAFLLFSLPHPLPLHPVWARCVIISGTMPFYCSFCSFQSAIKGLTMGGLEVISITDNTPIPHNGCRPRKARRL